jgi:NAD(P)-dependent dehydrogenase (short-subunit alcohol dehydrogenase family)/aryl carrier-like protein
VYLITGGLGGIGLALARYLAKAVQARLVLVSRTGLTDRRKRGQHADTHVSADRVGEQIRAVRELESMGAEVMIEAVDVSDLGQMQATLRRVEERFGPVNGVIHAAGVGSGRLMQLGTADVAAEVLPPKIQGTLVLDAVVRCNDLDFFVLCSSLASVLGRLGQVDYVSANAFLDAHANHKRSTSGVFTASIGWDTWRDAGMALHAELPAELDEKRERLLEMGLSSEEGVEVFDRILHSGLPHVLVSTTDLRPRIAQQRTGSVPGPTARREPRALHPRPILQDEYVAPGGELEQLLANVWQGALGIEAVGIHDNIFELGADSLTVVRVSSQLQAEHGLATSVVMLYEAPTIELLAWKLGEPSDRVSPMSESEQRGQVRLASRKRTRPLRTR